MPVMTVKKLSVALEQSVAERAARAAELEGLSLSAWINAAAERALKIEDGLAAMEEWQAEHGAFTEEELAWAADVHDGKAHMEDYPGPPQPGGS